VGHVHQLPDDHAGSSSQSLLEFLVNRVSISAFAGAKHEEVGSPALPVGIDKFMSECRALTNVIGNGVAIVVSRWENELDPAKLREALTRPHENGETKSP
jgi:aerobic C4-dicarboxylate transport protein